MTNRPVSNRRSFSHGYARSFWAECHIGTAINNADGLVAVAYGFSDDPKSMTSEERDEYAALYASTETHGKRPDFLVYTAEVYARLAKKYPYMKNLDKTPDAKIADEVVTSAMSSIEAEHSSGDGQVKADQAIIKKRAILAAYQGIELTQSKFFGTYMKADDHKLLKNWQRHYRVPMTLVQFFSDGYTRIFDLARVEQGIRDNVVTSRLHRYPEGKKKLYHIPYTLGVTFASCDETPVAGAKRVAYPSGASEAVETVTGGKFTLTNSAARILRQETENKPNKQIEVRLFSQLHELTENGYFNRERDTTAISEKVRGYSLRQITEVLRTCVQEKLLARTVRENRTVYRVI